MSPITLGILAASGAATVGSYELITSTVLTSTAASVTFSNLDTAAAGYKHLQLRIAYRGQGNVNGDNPTLYFNGSNTYSNYRAHLLTGTGSAVSSQSLQSTQYPGFMIGQNLPDASSTAGIFGAVVADILNFQSSTSNKVLRSLSGGTGAQTAVNLISGLWLSTAPITSITVTGYAGTNGLASGCRLSLYGSRG